MKIQRTKEQEDINDRQRYYHQVLTLQEEAQEVKDQASQQQHK